MENYTQNRSMRDKTLDIYVFTRNLILETIAMSVELIEVETIQAKRDEIQSTINKLYNMLNELRSDTQKALEEIE